MAKEKNEFDELDNEASTSIGEDTFDSPPSEFSNGDTELTGDDMAPSQFIRSPEPGHSIQFEVEKVVRSNKTKGVNKTTKETFDIGLRNKKGEVTRTDIITTSGRFTINTWEVFFKLFGVDGVLTKYHKAHHTFKGAKIKITKHYPGNYANKPAKEIAKLLDMTLEKAEAYRKEIAVAMQERRLQTVELVN
jgi:hypothetical protein